MKTNIHTAADAFYQLFEPASEGKRFNDSFEAEQDEEIILKHLAFAEKLFPNNGIMLCPVSHSCTSYFSPNTENIVGIPHREIITFDIPKFFSHVHPEDLTAVQQCMAFMKSLSPYDPEKYRFAVQYRFRNKEGTYVHVRDEKFAIRVSEKSYLYLILFSNVSDDEKFYHVKLDVFKQVKGNFLKAYTYNPKQQEKEITPRQHDIARLIIKGFTNQEIADQLKVSINTVKNHKQTLFRKVNVKNSLELANYVRTTEN